MEIFKLIGIGIAGAVAATVIKNVKPEFTGLVILSAGLIMLIYLLNSLGEVVTAFTGLVDKSGLDNRLFAGILKIIGIGYLTEYSAGICEDADAKSLGMKIQLGGKITIFLMSLPILTALIEVVEKLAL